MFVCELKICSIGILEAQLGNNAIRQGVLYVGCDSAILVNLELVDSEAREEASPLEREFALNLVVDILGGRCEGGVIGTLGLALEGVLEVITIFLLIEDI